jgi:AcrR family transcriptional regulator
MVTNIHGTILGRRQRNKARVQQQLRAAALQLFRTQGYEATSVQQIADTADTAKATFFNYYLTKEHVLGEFHKAAVQEILELHAKRSYASVRQAVIELTRVAARVMEREPQLTSALVRNLWGSPTLAEVDRSVGALFGTALQNILQVGKRNGEIRGDVDIKTARALVLSVLNGCIFDWVMSESKFNLPAAAAKRMTLLFAGFER